MLVAQAFDWEKQNRKNRNRKKRNRKSLVRRMSIHRSTDTEYEALEEQAPEVDLEGAEVSETTPDGEVIMESNGAAGSFRYWADSKRIKFKYLDTVARGFCVAHKCKGQYARNEAPAAEKDSKTEPEKPSGVFVAFKEYNNKQSRSSSSAGQSVRNQFKHMGTLRSRRQEAAEDALAKPGEQSLEYKAWVCGVG